MKHIVLLKTSPPPESQVRVGSVVDGNMGFVKELSSLLFTYIARKLNSNISNECSLP